MTKATFEATEERLKEVEKIILNTIEPFMKKGNVRFLPSKIESNTTSHCIEFTQFGYYVGFKISIWNKPSAGYISLCDEDSVFALKFLEFLSENSDKYSYYLDQSKIDIALVNTKTNMVFDSIDLDTAKKPVEAWPPFVNIEMRCAELIHEIYRILSPYGPHNANLMDSLIRVYDFGEQHGLNISKVYEVFLRATRENQKWEEERTRREQNRAHP